MQNNNNNQKQNQEEEDSQGQIDRGEKEQEQEKQNQNQNQNHKNHNKGDDGRRRSPWHGKKEVIPTKTYDGGGRMNYAYTGSPQTNPTEQGQGEEPSQLSVSGGGAQGDGSSTSTTAGASQPAPDSFQTYSDNDTRMETLLGLEPALNPNDGEERENWRHLVGFQGLGGRRRPAGDDHGHENEGEGEAQAASVSNNGDGNGDTTTPPRQTRLSWELHASAFANMWWERGEMGPRIDGVDDQGWDILDLLQLQVLQQRQQNQQQHEGDEEDEDEDENPDANGQDG